MKTLNKFDFVTEHYQKNRTLYLKRISRAVYDHASAEDVLHDAYERALKYWGAYNKDELFDKWFHLIIKNAIRDWHNAERGTVDVDLDLEEGVETIEKYQIRNDLVELISKRHEAHREILTLYFLKEYSMLDISKITDNTYHVVAQAIHRFRKVLEKRYG